MHPKPIPPGPGLESVWDYPRPPRLERSPSRLRVILGGVTVADTRSAWRVLETSHPPGYYLPREDIDAQALLPTAGESFCEWKGRARYFDVQGGGQLATRAAWAYPAPVAAFAPMANHVAFYAAAMDACFVDEERVVPQPGGFYGGWITPLVVGPFKGVPGSQGW